VLSNHPGSSISAEAKSLKLTATDHENKSFLRAAAFSTSKQLQPVTVRNLEQISSREGFMNSREISIFIPAKFSPLLILRAQTKALLNKETKETSVYLHDFKR